MTWGNSTESTESTECTEWRSRAELKRHAMLSTDCSSLHPPIGMSPDQCHHYIPRFILKNFSDETLRREGPQILLPGSHVQTPGSQSQIPVTIKTYRAPEKRITMEDIDGVYGTQSMFQGIAEDDWRQFEKLLGRMESSAAMFVRQILSESQDISLTRTSLGDFKRFLLIMMNKNNIRRLQYGEEGFDMLTRHSIQRHMEFNRIKTVREVWFENLKWILKTPVEGIDKEFARADAVKSPFKAYTSYQGPIHIMELMELAPAMTMSVCIWEAQEGSEFILSEKLWLF